MLEILEVQEDLYPSRVAPAAKLLDRKDPVIWPMKDGPVNGPLSADQISLFAQHGFLFLEGAFNEQEITHLTTELKRMENDPNLRNAPESIFEPGGGELRSLFDVHHLSELFGRLAADRRMAQAAMQILGSDVYIHQSRVNLKPGFRGEQFYWHSDFETWHVEDGMPRMRALSCSLLLTANNPFNGPLMVVPGSHMKFVSCVGKTPENHYKQSLRKQEYGVPDEASLSRLVQEGSIIAPTGPAGSLLIFDCNLMHGSAGNISPWPRSNVFFVYNSVANRLESPFCGLDPRPEFIASRRTEVISPLESFGARTSN